MFKKFKTSCWSKLDRYIEPSSISIAFWTKSNVSYSLLWRPLATDHRNWRLENESMLPTVLRWIKGMQFINEDFLPEFRNTLIREKIYQYESSKICTFEEYIFVFERFFLSRSLYFAHKIIFWVTCFDLSSLSNTDLRNRTYEIILRSVHIVSCPLIYKTIYFHFPFCLTQSS